jgi:6-phosphogluconolactonase
MRGELPPKEGALAYHDEISQIVDAGIGLMLLGLGDDAHVGANFPNSPSLYVTDKLCVAVHRPDGLDGLTLTPPAITAGSKILILATGAAKAEAVRRVVEGSEPIIDCPARMLVDHPNTTMLVDNLASSQLA